MTYQQQIKDPRWQRKRLTVLNFRKFKCQSCGRKDEELHVHHPYYKRGAMIWEYDKTELECLCHRCHKEAHAIDERIRKALAVCKDKQKVLDFILSVNRGVPELEVDVAKPAESRSANIVLDEEQDDGGYIKWPKPVNEEEAERRAEEFFEKMSRLFG